MHLFFLQGPISDTSINAVYVITYELLRIHFDGLPRRGVAIAGNEGASVTTMKPKITALKQGTPASTPI